MIGANQLIAVPLPRLAELHAAVAAAVLKDADLLRPGTHHDDGPLAQGGGAPVPHFGTSASSPTYSQCGPYQMRSELARVDLRVGVDPVGNAAGRVLGPDPAWPFGGGDAAVHRSLPSQRGGRARRRGGGTPAALRYVKRFFFCAKVAMAERRPRRTRRRPQRCLRRRHRQRRERRRRRSPSSPAPAALRVEHRAAAARRPGMKVGSARAKPFRPHGGGFPFGVAAMGCCLPPGGGADLFGVAEGEEHATLSPSAAPAAPIRGPGWSAPPAARAASAPPWGRHRPRRPAAPSAPFPPPAGRQRVPPPAGVQPRQRGQPQAQHPRPQVVQRSGRIPPRHAGRDQAGQVAMRLAGRDAGCARDIRQRGRLPRSGQSLQHAQRRADRADAPPDAGGARRACHRRRRIRTVPRARGSASPAPGGRKGRTARFPHRLRGGSASSSG